MRCARSSCAVVLAGAAAAARNRRRRRSTIPTPHDARRVQGGGGARARRDRRAGRGHRARERQRHRVGRRRGLGRSRSARAGHRRHPLPRRLGEQDASSRWRWSSSTRTASSTSMRRWPSLVPEVAIDNPWAADDAGHGPPPARAHGRLRRHALQRDLRPRRRPPICRSSRCCMRNPASRRVRWQAGHADVGTPIPATASPGSSSRRSRAVRSTSSSKQRIFRPLEMTTSSFRRAPDRRPGAGAGLCRAHRPAGGSIAASTCGRRARCRPRRRSSRTSCRRCSAGANAPGRRREATSSIPSTTRTWSGRGPRWPARAGVRSGYGLGIVSTITLPYHVLGHNGGIDGFLSAYGYSPSRDVGYVVLINSTHAPAALTRLTVAGDPLSEARRRAAAEAVACGHARRTAAVTRATTATPARGTRSWPALQFLRDGRTIGALEGDQLVLTPDFGAVRRRSCR